MVIWGHMGQILIYIKTHHLPFVTLCVSLRLSHIYGDKCQSGDHRGQILIFTKKQVKSQAGVTWGHRGQILIFTKIDTACLLYIAHL